MDEVLWLGVIDLASAIAARRLSFIGSFRV